MFYDNSGKIFLVSLYISSSYLHFIDTNINEAHSA